MNDLIRRQAAIDAIKGLPTWWADGGGYYGGAQPPMEALLEPNDVISAIDNLPSAQQWIPCSERLPPELKPVNVTWINRQPPTYYEKIKDKPFTDTAVYYEGKWYWQSAVCVDMLKEYGESLTDEIVYGVEIVAWMPLPEPYREETES